MTSSEAPLPSSFDVHAAASPADASSRVVAVVENTTANRMTIQTAGFGRICHSLIERRSPPRSLEDYRAGARSRAEVGRPRDCIEWCEQEQDEPGCYAVGLKIAEETGGSWLDLLPKIVEHFDAFQTLLTSPFGTPS